MFNFSDLEFGSLIQYNIVKEGTNNYLTSTVISQNYNFDLKVSRIEIWGVIYFTAEVALNGVPDACQWQQVYDVIEVCKIYITVLTLFYRFFPFRSTVVTR